MDRRYATRMAAILSEGPLNSTQMANIPFQLSSIGGALGQTLTEGLRTFYRSVYPRGAS
jgi:hypothetical protein